MVEGISRRIRALPLNQLIRFGVVGVASNLVGYTIYLLITYSGVDPKLTVTLLYPVGTLLSFAGNRKWTFNSNDRTAQAGVKHIFVYALGYVLNLGILAYFVDYLGFAHQLVQLVAIFIVALFLFVAMKFFVFANKS